MGQCCAFLNKNPGQNITKEFTAILSQTYDDKEEEEQLSEKSYQTEKQNSIIKNVPSTLSNQFKESTNIEFANTQKNQNQSMEIESQKQRNLENEGNDDNQSLTEQQIQQIIALECLKKSLTNSNASITFQNGSLQGSLNQNIIQNTLNENNNNQEFALHAIVVEQENLEIIKETKISKQKSNSLRQSLKLDQLEEVNETIEKLKKSQFEKQSEIINESQIKEEIEIDSQKKSLKSSFNMKMGQQEKKKVRFKIATSMKKQKNSKKYY